LKDIDFIKSQVALRCWIDGKDEGLNAMLGIAFVIRNRVRAGWYGGDWLQILSHHHEWSGNLNEEKTIQLPDPRVLSFMMLLQQMDGIFSGAADDSITIKRDGVASTISLNGPPPVALYYARLDKVNNDWFLDNISRCPDKHPMIAQVGLVSFFA
jgi:hypothetical protein